jgi:hypothetical protein
MKMKFSKTKTLNKDFLFLFSEKQKINKLAQLFLIHGITNGFHYELIIRSCLTGIVYAGPPVHLLLFSVDLKVKEKGTGEAASYNQHYLCTISMNDQVIYIKRQIIYIEKKIVPNFLFCGCSIYSFFGN